jgi:hypothetical protein
MAKDHIGSTCVLQHFGGNIPGEGTAWLGVAIMAAEPDRSAVAERRGGDQQSCRRTNQNFLLSSVALGHSRAYRGDFAEASAQTVHFPVPRDEGAWPMSHAESSRNFTRPFDRDLDRLSTVL